MNSEDLSQPTRAGIPESASSGEAPAPPAESAGEPSTPAFPAGSGIAHVPGWPAPAWDRYRCDRLLGAGGMGRVFKAWDPRLRRWVALKFLHADDPELTARFLREAQAQARLEHPHICRVYEVGEAAGRPYIAMQYIDGSALGARAGGMTLEQKVLVMSRVAEAIHAAHRLGIIHRDIKPANIMLEETEGGIHPYVVDFGLVREIGVEGLTLSGASLGTPQFMAPEQALGKMDRVDRRSDVYSLGATLYTVVAGRPPLGGETPSGSHPEAPSRRAGSAAEAVGQRAAGPGHHRHEMPGEGTRRAAMIRPAPWRTTSGGFSTASPWPRGRPAGLPPRQAGPQEPPPGGGRPSWPWWSPWSCWGSGGRPAAPRRPRPSWPGALPRRWSGWKDSCGEPSRWSRMTCGRCRRRSGNSWGRSRRRCTGWAPWRRGRAIPRWAAVTWPCRSMAAAESISKPPGGWGSAVPMWLTPWGWPWGSSMSGSWPACARSPTRTPAPPAGKSSRRPCGTPPAPPCAVAPGRTWSRRNSSRRCWPTTRTGTTRRWPRLTRPSAGCRGCTRPWCWKGRCTSGKGPLRRGPAGTPRPGRNIWRPRRCTGRPPGSAGAIRPSTWRSAAPGNRSSIWKCGKSAWPIRRHTAGPWRRWRQPSGWRRTTPP